MKTLFTLLSFSLISLFTHSQSWSAIGNGVNGRVSCFSVYNGELYVGGQFYNSNGISPFGLLKWNGISFDTVPGTHLLGSSRIEAMAVYNNELYVGGGFSPNSSNGPSIFSNIAKWDGTNFSDVDGGCSNVVYSMEVYNGNLYVGGDMETAGGITVYSIGKWNGSEWSDLNGGLTNSARVFELEVYKGELYVAGGFTHPQLITQCIAKWNDTLWSEVGAGGISNVIYAMEVYNNELYIPRYQTVSGITTGQPAKWDGTDWSLTGDLITGNNNGVGNIQAMHVYNDELYLGGSFSTIDGDSVNSIARYDGYNWSSLGSGTDSTNIIGDTLINWPFDTIYFYAPHTISAFQVFNNELYVGGRFNMVGGIQTHNVAKWTTPVNVAKHTHNEPSYIYPNPTSGFITITIPQEGFIEVLDLQGRIVKSYFEVDKTTSIDVSELAPGVYVVKANTGDGILTKKFVKNY